MRASANAVQRWVTLATATTLAVLAVVVAGTQPGTSLADDPAIDEISAAATAAQTAARLTPPVPRPDRIAVVGDSLAHMAGNRLNTGGSTLADTLRGVGWTSVTIDALPSRSIWYPTDTVYSGVHTVREMRAAGVDPDVWMVELGTNDLYWVKRCRCADPVAWSRDRIRMLLAEIGAGEHVFWVNVRRWGSSAAADAWNTALDQLVATGEIVAVVDWHTLSTGKQGPWFVDQAHLSVAGYRAWLAAIAAVVRLA